MRNGTRWALLAMATGAVAVGCGSTSDYANLPRPPQLITITAAIAHRHVLVSPDALGAGPVMLVVANDTGRSQPLTVSRGGAHALEADTGPINPGDTATLQLDLYPGSYLARADGGGIAPARIVVGASRASAQNALAQP